jgi:hypothetical protein
MDGVGKVLVVAVMGGAVLVGSGKMWSELRRLANRPPRPRQPWECGPR